MLEQLQSSILPLLTIFGDNRYIQAALAVALSFLAAWFFNEIIITGLNPDVLLQSVEIVTKEKEMFGEREIPDEYQVCNTSLRVLKLITGTAKLTSKWRNLDDFSRYDWDVDK